MRRSTALRLLAALFLPLFLLSACSSDDDEKSATDTGTETDTGTGTGTDDEAGDTGGDGGEDLNACLNTEAEVSEAFGVEVTEAEATSSGGAGATFYCTYTAADESSPMATSLQTGDIAVGIFESYGEDSEAESVEGIGDGAVWSAGVLFVRKGDKVLGLQAGGGSPIADDEEAVRAALEKLARSAAERL